MTGGLRERRLVTILFSDLSDSTGIAAGLEPELYADLLEQIRAIADRVIPAHGGDVIRIDGDGMLCIFGYPNRLRMQVDARQKRRWICMRNWPRWTTAF